MSRTRLDKSQNDSSVQQSEPVESAPPAVEAEPAVIVPAAVAPASEPLVVDKQQVLHDAPAQSVLLPGKQSVNSNDLLDEISKLIAEAEQTGNLALSAELHSLQSKVGDLLHHLHSLDKSSAADAIRPLYLKVIAFFKK